MALDSLTEFYTIRIGDLRRLIKIHTEGMPTDERDKAIFRYFINKEEKFINYLAFMLTEDVEQYILESQQLEKNWPITARPLWNSKSVPHFMKTW